MLSKLPHVEYQPKEQEIGTLSINHYILGAKFCRQNLKHGGTSIFVHESLAFTNIELQEFCRYPDTETCAFKTNLTTAMIYVICLYRSPTGNFVCFVQGTDTILNNLRNQMKLFYEAI